MLLPLILPLALLLMRKVTAHVQPAEVVVVTAAAGGTGHLAVQLAVAAGATVVAVVGGPAKARAVEALGAHHVIDYSRQVSFLVIDGGSASGWWGPVSWWPGNDWWGADKWLMGDWRTGSTPASLASLVGGWQGFMPDCLAG